MVKLGVGTIVALVGAIIGILSVILSIIIPESLAWYRLYYEEFEDYEIFLSGFGFNRGLSSKVATFVLFGGILIILGAIASVAGAFTERRNVALGGAVLMIIGPLFLLVDLLLTTSDFAEAVDLYVDASNGNIFAGSYSNSVTAEWGIHIGFFLPIVAGVIGLVGGALVER